MWLPINAQAHATLTLVCVKEEDGGATAARLQRVQQQVFKEKVPKRAPEPLNNTTVTVNTWLSKVKTLTADTFTNMRCSISNSYEQMTHDSTRMDMINIS